MSVRDRIKNVISAVLSVPVEELSDDHAADELPEWDSLRHIELMLAIETEFELQIPSEVMLELTSIGAIDAYLRTHAAGGPR